MENNIEYCKDGIMINGELLLLSKVIKECDAIKISEEKLALLVMEWDGWRGFDDGVFESIVLPIEKIEVIKKYIVGRTIFFGEIAGKHSEVFNTLDEEDMEVIDDPKVVGDFISANPSMHKYNHSFLYTFSDYASDGGYDDITDEQAKEFNDSF